MNPFENIGKALMIMGALILLLGIIITAASGLPLLGRLPGDIFIHKDGFSFYFPLATSVIISILLTVIINIVGRLLR